jgi:hypothetical protein
MSFPSAYLGPVVASLICFAWGSPLTADEPSPTAAEAPTPMEPSEPLETVAPETVTAPAGRYLVESLAVDGAGRESVKHVVVSESRLTPGRAYSEADIGQAVRRVKRLAFVLDARPVLRRGSAPGRYQLVFTIVETAHVLLSADGGHASDDPLDPSAAAWNGGLAVGLDRFFGSLSQVRGSVASRGHWYGGYPNDTSFTQAGLGVTQYDLLGRASRLDLDVTATRRRVFGPYYVNSLYLSGTLLRPISAYQSLRLRFTATLLRNDPDWLLTSNARTEMDMSWLYDTTDDPFAALTGTRLSADVAVPSRENAQVWSKVSPELGQVVRYESGSTAFSVKGARVFCIGGHLGAEPNLGAGVIGFEGDRQWNPYVAVGLNLRLVGVGPRNRNRLFAQASVSGTFTRYSRSQVSEGEVFPARWTKERSVEFSAGLRTRLAIVRLHLSWQRYTRHGLF